MTVGRFGLLLFTLFFLAACSEGSMRGAPTASSDVNASVIDQPTGLASDTKTRPSTASRDVAEMTAVPSLPVTPPRPQGEVPQPLVGVWSGGQGSKSGYRLTFFADSTYELIHERNTAIPAFREVGYCVGNGSSLLLRPVMVKGPVKRRERTARWDIQPSSVVDVLTVIDEFDGEFSYVRIS
ncbi:MAG: hypothetical protein M3460_22635 [Actinomycetota bacterium]|nr:hypothetical protein [Actinomycetota bacterium]